MKVLLISSVYKSEVVGPARFARLLESSPHIEVDILTENVKDGKHLKNVELSLSWWQKKMKLFFSRKFYTKKILQLQDEYDVLLYNSSVLVEPNKINRPYIVMINDEKLADLQFSFRFDYLRRLILRNVEHHAVKNAKKVIVNSSYMKARITQLYNVEKSKVYMLHKGIDLSNKKDEFRDTMNAEVGVKLLFVKNDFKLGGLLELIDALKSLPKIKFHLSIIGTSEKVHTYLKNMPNVTYDVLGYQSNESVIKHMYSSDILCVPSRHEPLGVAIMEGLAVGIPTITTGVGGLPEVTENGKHVWQCKPFSSKSLGEQIQQCITHPTERKMKSATGKDYISTHFSFSEVVFRLKEIIQD